MGTKVKVEEHKGCLRLRWSYLGKRPTLSLGWKDSPPARAMAQKKASEIEGDIITGNYDPTWKKYRTHKAPKSDLTVVQLIERFSASKVISIKETTELSRMVLSSHSPSDQQYEES